MSLTKTICPKSTNTHFPLPPDPSYPLYYISPRSIDSVTAPPPPPAAAAEAALRNAHVSSTPRFVAGPPPGMGPRPLGQRGERRGGPRCTEGPMRPPRPVPLHADGPHPRHASAFRPPMGEGPRPYKRRFEGDAAPEQASSATPTMPRFRGAYTRLPPTAPSTPPVRSAYALDDDNPMPPATTTPATPTASLTRTDYRSLVDRFEALTRECQRLSGVVGELAQRAPPSPLATPTTSPTPSRPTSPPARPASPPARSSSPPAHITALQPSPAASPRSPTTSPPSPPRRARHRSRWASESRSRTPTPARTPSPIVIPTTPEPAPPFVPPAFSDGANSQYGSDGEESAYSADVI